MGGYRTSGPEGGERFSRAIEDGTMVRRPTPAPGPIGLVPSSSKGSAKQDAGPSPSPVTIVFVTLGDTRSTSYAGQFNNRDDMHWAQADHLYGPTDHIYQVESDSAAIWRLNRLLAAGIRACRVVFLGHGDDSGFFFSVIVTPEGQVSTNNEERRVFDRNDTALIRKIGEILDPSCPRVEVRFSGCEIGQNRQLMRDIRAAVQSRSSASGDQPFEVTAPRTRYNLQAIINPEGQVIDWRSPPRTALPDRTLRGQR